MTDLTEQWKKEHSIKENQHYYIKDTRDNIYIDYFWGDGWLDNSNEDIIEVLAKVPSYEECERLNWYAGNGVEENAELKSRLKKTQKIELEVRKENEKLKDLLKACQGSIATLLSKRITEVNGIKQEELLTKIDEVLK